jgi:molybdopterin synthase sulfur carrier subunit
MIHVRLYANLTRTAGGGTTEFEVEARDGLTVNDVLKESGVRSQDVHIVMINGHGVMLDSQLDDGDRLGLFPAVSGG